MCEKNNNSELAKKEIKLLTSAVKCGDQTAFAKLNLMYKPLMLSLTAYYSDLVSPEDLEEMNCDAVSALYNAAMSYDDEQEGVEFGLYAKICIKNRLATTYRACQHRARLRIVPLERENLDGDDERDDIFFTIDDDPLKTVIERESFEILRKKISDELSDYENRIWWLFMSEMSAREIAVSVSKDGDVEKAEKSVANALYRIRQKLRRALS